MTLLAATCLNGLSLAALYFVVASGFTLIFGLMRVVNLAHGSLYLLGGYAGFLALQASGSWLIALAAGFAAAAAVGLALQLAVFRRMEGQDLRQTLVSLGISLVLADLMLMGFGGGVYRIDAPELLFGPVRTGVDLLPFYPKLRLATILLAVAVGVALWLFLTRTRLGMIIRAGVDDRAMVQASGIDVHLVFAATFAIGAGLAGMAGVLGGTMLSLSPGEDLRFLLVSLIVVIVGGMGSVGGSALGALLIGFAEQFGLTYAPTYGVVFTFLILVAVLAFRPQGLMGRAR